MRGAIFLFLISILAVFVAGCRTGIADTDSSSLDQSKQSEAPLIGIFYDLKQTPDRKPTDVTPESYPPIIDEFLSKGWDESVLNRYYRVSKPLNTTQIYVPTLNADKAPEAFGVEKLVQGTRWVVHYKGQVSPPESGIYRFWGIADDFMAVAVNGKTVLVGNRFDTKLPKTNWHASEGDGAHAGDGELRPGDWMTLKEGEIIDLDIVLGDRPGGVFNAYLMIEKQGATYQRDPQGHPILPIFQIAPYNTPRGDADFATGFPIWKSYQ